MSPPRPGRGPTRDLLRAGHVGPGAVVTVVVIGLGVAAAVPAIRLAVLAVGVLAGQLVIGWVNDLVDVDRDRAGGRSDKPLVHPGPLTPEIVVWAARTAAVVAVVASLAVGLLAGALHLVAVGAGLVYDRWLKATPASALPYAVAFGLLPVFTVAARPDDAVAATWAVVAGACFGVGVHLANALPDLEVDEVARVRGLPQRLGRRRSLAAALVVLLGGCLATLVGGDLVGWAATAAAVLLVALLTAILGAAARGDDEVVYRLVMALGVVTVGLVVANGSGVVA